MRRLDHFLRPRKVPNWGKGFVKICRVKKSTVGDGGERVLALDDAFGNKVNFILILNTRSGRHFVNKGKLPHYTLSITE